MLLVNEMTVRNPPLLRHPSTFFFPLFPPQTIFPSEFSSAAITPGGCTLRFLLEWAWNRVVTLRSRADEVVTSLFDWSASGHVETKLLLLLQQTENQLKSLASLVFSLSLQNATPTTEQVSLFKASASCCRVLPDHRSGSLQLSSACLSRTPHIHRTGEILS